MQPVKYLSQEPGAQKNRQHLTAHLNRIADANAAGIFKHLHIGCVSVYAQHFGHEAFITDTDEAHFIFLDRLTPCINVDETFTYGQHPGGDTLSCC